MKKIIIVDYGYGNLFSLAKALSYVGACPVISSDPGEVRNARGLIMPGVGAFGDGMAELEKRGLKTPLLEATSSDKPLLGICLGMQFLFDKSYEFGEHNGLGILKGEVKEIEISKKPFCKIPHIGWSPLLLPKNENRWKNEILNGIEPGSEAYFVHSFAPYPDDSSDVVSNTCYCESIIPAVVAKGATVGVQFHLEKSGEVGILILKNFLSLI